MLNGLEISSPNLNELEMRAELIEQEPLNQPTSWDPEEESAVDEQVIGPAYVPNKKNRCAERFSSRSEVLKLIWIVLYLLANIGLFVWAYLK